MLLILVRPRARVKQDFQRGVFVSLYESGLVFETPGDGAPHPPEWPQFGNDRHASIARLLEAVGGLECPVCQYPLARDVWQSIAMAERQTIRCRACATQSRLEDDDHAGLRMVDVEAEVAA